MPTVPYTGFTASSLPATVTTTPVVDTSTSPTVISNQNVKDKVTDMTNTVNQMSQGRGMTSDGQTTKYADGTIATDNYQEPTLPQGSAPIYGTVNGQANRIVGYQTPNVNGGGLGNPTYFDSNSSTPAQTPEEKQTADLLASMKASTDANTAAAVSSIQQKFANLKAIQQQANMAMESQKQNALLMGGVTGQGSSSQYAPLSSTNIVQAQMNYGVQQLANLDAQEQDLIQSARAAGQQQNFQLMEKQLALVKQKQEDKQKQQQKLNELAVKETEKHNTNIYNSKRDLVIADLYAQGVTDPTEILKEANKGGTYLTLKDINDGLKNIATKIGTDTKGMTTDAKEFFALRERGEIPSSILSLSTDAEQLNAYLRNKAIARKVPAAAKVAGAVVSGSLKYSPQDMAEDSKVLEASRGADNYVDPSKYQDLYKAWVANGGLLKDFLAKFPPKNYVNPANDWLPVFLRPTKTKTSTSGKRSV